MMVKVCGMRSPENIQAVADTGPDLMGFIFYPGSPRFFRGNLPTLPVHLKKTGVFVNATVNEMITAATKHRLDYLQLHGDESPETCRDLQQQLLRGEHHTELIKVFSLASVSDLDKIADYEGLASYFLFDTKGKYRGGNGTAFNWSILEHYHHKTPFFLSGGISADDTTAIQKFTTSPAGTLCVGVDINSGFETEPGIKDAARVKTFIEQISRINRKNKK